MSTSFAHRDQLALVAPPPKPPEPKPAPGSEPAWRRALTFCERHRTTCQVGRTVWQALGGKRKRSACHEVKPDDTIPFVAGRIAQYKVWDTADWIAYAWNTTQKDVFDQLGYEAVAGIHIQYFVPLCRNMEGDRLTTDPNSKGSREFRAMAYRDFADKIRRGVITFSSFAADRGGGDIPPGWGDDPGRGEGGVALAGIGGVAALLIVGGILLAARGFK